MIPYFADILLFLLSFFRSRYHLGLEILALRQQLGVLNRKRPHPRFKRIDRLFWVLLRHLWPSWSNILIIVKPETVVAWHRAGFRLFWRLRSRCQNLGRPKINNDIRALIRQMVQENPSWGAPRIHGEILKLGFEVSERSVSRYIKRLSPRVGGLHHRYDWQRAAKANLSPDPGFSRSGMHSCRYFRPNRNSALSKTQFLSFPAKPFFADYSINAVLFRCD